MAPSIAPSNDPVADPGAPSPADQTASGLTQDVDEAAAAEVELARAAAEDVALPGTVGRHLGVRGEGPGLVLHTFESLARGYRGWQWAVSLAHVPGSAEITVCDSVLLPGDDSVLAPVWVPWSDRLAPGDLGAGDELPYRADDPLLVPAFTITDDDDADQLEFWELGLGRVRVLGPEGRDEAAQRWYTGESGPASDVALQAPAQCSTCGYFVPLSGSLRQSFGVCANAWSPSDASVVSLDHGCGAHSETDLAPAEPEPIPAPIVDDTMFDVLVLESEPGPEPLAEVAAEEDQPVAEAVADAEPIADAEPVLAGQLLADELVAGLVAEEAAEEVAEEVAESITEEPTAPDVVAEVAAAESPEAAGSQPGPDPDGNQQPAS